MTDYSCDGCLRIIDVKHHCISIPNVFDFDMSICVNLCNNCSSLSDWFVEQYHNLYEEQSMKLKDKRFSMTTKNARNLR